MDGKAAGVIEAKKIGSTLTGVEIQSDKYKTGLPADLPAWYRPLPFCYQSTGVETRFTNDLDPVPRSRNVFLFRRPETFEDWANAEPSACLDKVDVESLVFPLSPFEEQKKIVELVEEKFSIMNKIEAAVEKNLKRADRLWQSILKKAFTCKLVPKICDDESTANSQKQSARL